MRLGSEPAPSRVRTARRLQNLPLLGIADGGQCPLGGTVWTTTSGGGSYSARFKPNGFTDVYGASGVTDDPLAVPCFCVNEPAARLPCTPMLDMVNVFSGGAAITPAEFKRFSVTVPFTSTRNRSTRYRGSRSTRSLVENPSTVLVFEVGSLGKAPPKALLPSHWPEAPRAKQAPTTHFDSMLVKGLRNPILRR